MVEQECQNEKNGKGRRVKKKSKSVWDSVIGSFGGEGQGGGLARRQLSNSIITYHKGPDGLLDRYHHHLHHHQVSNFFAFSNHRGSYKRKYPTFSLRWSVEHCSRVPISLCGFHVTESALRIIITVIMIMIINNHHRHHHPGDHMSPELVARKAILAPGAA